MSHRREKKRRRRRLGRRQAGAVVPVSKRPRQA